MKVEMQTRMKYDMQLRNMHKAYQQDYGNQ